MPDCLEEEQSELVRRARQLMATYSEMEELIRLGAYRRGTNPEVDEAIAYQPMLDAYLSQTKGEHVTIEAGYEELARILNSDPLNSETLNSETQTELQSESSEGAEL